MVGNIFNYYDVTIFGKINSKEIGVRYGISYDLGEIKV